MNAVGDIIRQFHDAGIKGLEMRLQMSLSLISGAAKPFFIRGRERLQHPVKHIALLIIETLGG